MESSIFDWIADIVGRLHEAEPWEAKELIKRHVYTLRQKLKNQPEQPQVILNVRGVGYSLAT